MQAAYGIRVPRALEDPSHHVPFLLLGNSMPTGCVVNVPARKSCVHATLPAVLWLAEARTATAVDLIEANQPWANAEAVLLLCLEA